MATTRRTVKAHHCPYSRGFSLVHAAIPRLSRTLAALTLAAASLAAALPAATANAATHRRSCAPPVIAHRGDSERAPENTLPAFRSALRAGAPTLETDVQFTADGVPVLMHDLSLDRTTDGAGPVSALTFAQVESLDAGAWFGPRFAGVRVPQMAALLALARLRQVHVQLELKVRPTPEQLAVFLQQVRGSGMARYVVINSFLEPAVLDVRAAAPDIDTAVVDGVGFRSPDSVLRYGSTYIVNSSAVTAARVRAWAGAGIHVRPWVVDSAKGWRRMSYDRTAAIITDAPARYLSWARHGCR